MLGLKKNVLLDLIQAMAVNIFRLMSFIGSIEREQCPFTLGSQL